jgi:hypothetical protein
VLEVNSFVSGDSTGDGIDGARDPGPDVHEIQRMKAELQAHYERFKALRTAGRNAEAVAQFNVTLKAAGDLLETSTRVLKEVALKAAEGRRGPAAGGRVLHLPRHPRTH